MRINEWLRIRSLTALFSIFIIVATFTSFAFTPIVSSAAGLVPCGDESYAPGEKVNGKDVGGTVKNPCKFEDLLKLVSNIVDFLIITGTAVAALSFGYAGFLMMTANGEMGKIEEAKAIFGKVMTGFIIMLSAWLIVYAIESAFLDSSFETYLK